MITHCIRATAISDMFDAKIEGHEIRKVTGHSNMDQVNYYDKSGQTHNFTKTLSLYGNI